MRLLDRYLLRELMIPLPYCLGGFLIFFISSDLISELDDFREDRMGILDVAEYYLTRLPEYLVLLFPIVLLLALLYAMTTHSRHQEFTAMRAAGVGLWRFCAPYFGVGLAMSVLVFGLSESVVPRTKEHAEWIRHRRLSDRQDGQGRWQKRVELRNEREGRTWLIEAFNLDTGLMIGPHVEWTRPDGSRAVIAAEQAEYVDGCWVFTDGRVFDDDPESTTPIRPFDTLGEEALKESPEAIRSEYQVSRMESYRQARKVSLTLAEIRNYKYLHPVLTDREHALLNTQMHARLAQPWTCLVVVLIAVPFGVMSGRRNAFVGVATSIFICVGYFFFQQLTMGLGTGQHLPPELAGWLPNGVFGLLGIGLALRAR
jgi:lipopolysaccharide export system permease protein